MSAEIKVFLAKRRREARARRYSDHTESSAQVSPSASPPLHGSPSPRIPPSTRTPGKSSPTDHTVVSQVPAHHGYPKRRSTPAVVAARAFPFGDHDISSSESAAEMEGQQVAKADAVWERLRADEESIRATTAESPTQPVSCERLLDVVSGMLVAAAAYNDVRAFERAEVAASHVELLTRWPWDSRRRYSYEDWLVLGSPPSTVQEHHQLERERCRVHREAIMLVALVSANLGRFKDAIGAARECIREWDERPPPSDPLLEQYFPRYYSPSLLPCELLLNYLSILTAAQRAGESGVHLWNPAAGDPDGEVLRISSIVAARCGRNFLELKQKDAVTLLMTKGCVEQRDAYAGLRAMVASQLCAAKIHIALTLFDELRASTAECGVESLKATFRGICVTLLLASAQRLVVEELGGDIFPLYTYLLALIADWSDWLPSWQNGPIDNAKSERWKFQVAAARTYSTKMFGRKPAVFTYDASPPSSCQTGVNTLVQVAPYCLGLFLLDQCRRRGAPKANLRGAGPLESEVSTAATTVGQADVPDRVPRETRNAVWSPNPAMCSPPDIRRVPLLDLPTIESCVEVFGPTTKAPHSPVRKSNAQIPQSSSDVATPTSTTVLVITSGSVVSPSAVAPIRTGLGTHHAPLESTSNVRWKPDTAEWGVDEWESRPASARRLAPPQPMRLPSGGLLYLNGGNRARSSPMSRSFKQFGDSPVPVANVYGFPNVPSTPLHTPGGTLLDSTPRRPSHIAAPPNNDLPARKPSIGHRWPLN